MPAKKNSTTPLTFNDDNVNNPYQQRLHTMSVAMQIAEKRKSDEKNREKRKSTLRGNGGRILRGKGLSKRDLIARQ
ncbi:hypothetical protein V6N12_041861 [Hibiscus sabdariffa]|uniref:Uncharacterized protein n=1 Tax=Hibiscus sabdariffa TaxID=183260 RepID=A0ABR2ED31_9ROSI